eukprot:m.39827 g.39827  ORF g.39827 m.39827 type:complete len:333 (+) comp8008_c0_seq1:2582-3580(+)
MAEEGALAHNLDVTDELESLTAIFGTDLAISDCVGGMHRWSLKLGNGRTFSVGIPREYPHKPACNFEIDNGDATQDLVKALTERAEQGAKEGEATVFELFELVRDGLESPTQRPADIYDPTPDIEKYMAAEPVSPCLDLPIELWQVVFACLPLRETLEPALVCKRWRVMIESDSRWRARIQAWLTRWPGVAAYQPRRRYSALFTFYALVRERPRILEITRLTTDKGIPGVGGKTCRTKQQCASLSTVSDTKMGTRVQESPYGPTQLAPARAAVAWLSEPVDLQPSIRGVRRLLLLPDGAIAVSLPSIPDLFTLTDRRVQWREISEPIYLPLR